MANLDQIMDYVADNVIVEQGTEDIWTYRKWSNGIAECWGRRTGTAGITVQWGQIYFANAFSQSLPTGLFTEVPSIQMLNHSSNSALVMGGSVLNKDSFNIHLVRGTSQTNATFSIGFYCIGKWK